jgi:hypothetical protein
MAVHGSSASWFKRFMAQALHYAPSAQVLFKAVSQPLRTASHLAKQKDTNNEQKAQNLK